MGKLRLFSLIWIAFMYPEVEGRPFRCGSTLYAAHAGDYLFSPGYPFGYPNYMDCEWIIQAPEGHQVEIGFGASYTESCCDIIEVRDGNSSSAGLLATYRGDANKNSYMSSFGSIYVRFKSDDSGTDHGFEAYYRIATIQSKNCTDSLTASQQVQELYSPGWPNRYEDNLYCSWTITAPEGKSVSLTFKDLHIEPCCDFVLIRYGTTMDSEIYQPTGTVTTPDEYIQRVSPGSVVQVIFRSDEIITRRGFRIAYQAVDRVISPEKDQKKPIECGGKLEVPLVGHGTLTTPGYPKAHAHNMDCVWILVAPPTKQVRLWFTSVNTEACCDFVMVRDGEKPSSRKLAVLGGEVIPFAFYTSTSNILRVHFQSDKSTSKSGFRANYEVVSDSSNAACGGVLTAETEKRKYISSPNWPKVPGKDQCTWRISAPAEYSVMFVVIGYTTIKELDLLYFYDGDSNHYFAEMTQHREENDDTSFYSNSNVMTVVYRSNIRPILRGGFRAYYKAVKKIPSQTSLAKSANSEKAS